MLSCAGTRRRPARAAVAILLAGALASLSDHDRELVALRYGADLSARQIAELLEARTNTIEVALHRALERLRRELIHEQSNRPPAAAADGVRL